MWGAKSPEDTKERNFLDGRTGWNEYENGLCKEGGNHIVDEEESTRR